MVRPVVGAANAMVAAMAAAAAVSSGCRSSSLRKSNRPACSWTIFPLRAVDLVLCRASTVPIALMNTVERSGGTPPPGLLFTTMTRDECDGPAAPSKRKMSRASPSTEVPSLAESRYLALNVPVAVCTPKFGRSLSCDTRMKRGPASPSMVTLCAMVISSQSRRPRLRSPPSLRCESRCAPTPPS